MILKKLKISHKVLIVILAGIIISSAFAAWSIVEGYRQTETLRSIYIENVTPLDDLRKIQLFFREIEYRMTAIQGDLLMPAGSLPYLERALEKIETAWGDIKETLKYYELSEETVTAMNTFEDGYSRFKLNVAGQLRKAYSENDPADVPDLYDEWLDYRPLIFKSADRLVHTLKEDVKMQYVESRRSIRKANIFVSITGAVTISFFAVFALLMRRSIKNPINTVVHEAELIASGDLTRKINVDSSDEMDHMAKALNKMIGHIGDAFSRIVVSVETMSDDTEGLYDLSKKLLHGAEEQSASTEQIAVSSEEMSRTITEMAKNSLDASQATKESFNTAAEGKEVVNQSVASIMKLADSVSEASKTIEGLGRHLDDIGEIVSVIDGIADQTNLLALNAAIEAARSGEYGRGFSVVADEVKKLAERTADATVGITEKIKTIQKESRDSVTVMETGRILAEESVVNSSKAGEALQKIVESSNRAMEMVNSMAVATEEQSAASEEVSQNMEHIAGIINEHVSMTTEVEKSASHLSALAQEIIVQTSYFKTGGYVYDSTEEVKSEYTETRYTDNNEDGFPAAIET